MLCRCFTPSLSILLFVNSQFVVLFIAVIFLQNKIKIIVFRYIAIILVDIKIVKSVFLQLVEKEKEKGKS